MIDTYDTASYAARTVASMQRIFAQGCLFCLFELVFQSTSLSNKWLKVWKLFRENLVQHRLSPLQVFSFLRVTCLCKPPLLWTAFPSRHAGICFPEHVSICPNSFKILQELQTQKRKSTSAKLMWPLPQSCVTNKMKNFGTAYPNLKLNVIQWIKSVQVFWVY